MRNAVMVVIFTLMLTGCGWFDRKMASFTGYTKICVEGVTYLQFPSGVTPQYQSDGKLVSCR